MPLPGLLDPLGRVLCGALSFPPLHSGRGLAGGTLEESRRAPPTPIASCSQQPQGDPLSGEGHLLSLVQ